MRTRGPPTRSGVPRFATLAVACAAGCAHLAPQGEGYRFRPELAVTQTVTVEAPDGRHAFLASLTRRGEELEVTLFDPVFSTPLLSSAWRQGRAEETLLAPGARPGDGKRLIALLREVYDMSYPLPVGGSTRAVSPRLSVQLEGIGPAPCTFPGRIVLRTRAGPVLAVTVETVEASCDSATAPRSPTPLPIRVTEVSTPTTRAFSDVQPVKLVP